MGLVPTPSSSFGLPSLPMDYPLQRRRKVKDRALLQFLEFSGSVQKNGLKLPLPHTCPGKCVAKPTELDTPNFRKSVQNMSIPSSLVRRINRAITHHFLKDER